jgi:hypothetical protein
MLKLILFSPSVHDLFGIGPNDYDLTRCWKTLSDPACHHGSAPISLLPARRSDEIVRDVLTVGDDQNSRHPVPWGIAANPLESLHAGHQLHSVDAAFGATEVNDLLVGLVKVIWKMDDSCAARLATGILVARTVRVNVDRSWVKQ